MIADTAYDSDPLRERLKKRGIELIAPYRENNRHRRYEDGRKLRRYKRRWIVESIPENPAFSEVSSSDRSLEPSVFNMFHCGPCIAFPLACWPGMVAMQSIATTTDDLKNREINAAEIHGVHPKWA